MPGRPRPSPRPDPAALRRALRELVPAAVPEDPTAPVDWAALAAAIDAPAPQAASSRGDAPTFGFAFPGRAEAAAAAWRPATATLTPDPSRSVRPAIARHVLLAGDNLEALRLMRRAYTGRAKAIVIDPPYNTGRSFLYPDDYADPAGAYLEATGQADAAGRPTRSDADASGRRHSRWMQMMLPRLMLARELLRPDGALIVTIDDHELHTLKALLHDVFGEERFVAHAIWRKRYTRSNNTSKFTSVVDHVLIYGRSEAFQPNLLPRPDKANARFKNPDGDPRGPWRATPFLNQVPPEARPNLAYPLTNPNTGQITHPTRKAWRVDRAGFDRLQADGRLWWGARGDRPVPEVKTFLSEVRAGLTPINFWDHTEAGHTDEAHGELKALFGGKPFDTPKPTRLIRHALAHVLRPASAPTPEGAEPELVVDFFAGSGTTGDAVMQLAHETGHDLRAVLVQLPLRLPDDHAGVGPAPHTVADAPAPPAPSDLAELCAERLRRRLAALDADGGGAPPAQGLRVLRLSFPELCGDAPARWADLVDGAARHPWDLALAHGVRLDEAARSVALEAGGHGPEPATSFGDGEPADRLLVVHGAPVGDADLFADAVAARPERRVVMSVALALPAHLRLSRLLAADGRVLLGGTP